MNIPLTNKRVLSFDIGGRHIFALSGKHIYKYNIESNRVEVQRELFQKDGLAREIIYDDNQLYCRDFCTFYVLDALTLKTVYEGKLGTDLSSDICGITFDEKYIYASIRNGTLAKIDKETYKTSYYKLTQTTFLMQQEGEKLYCVSQGSLYIFNKSDLSLYASLDAHKVCEGFIISDSKIITAGKDKLIIWDKQTLKKNK